MKQFVGGGCFAAAAAVAIVLFESNYTSCSSPESAHSNPKKQRSESVILYSKKCILVCGSLTLVFDCVQETEPLHLVHSTSILRQQSVLVKIVLTLPFYPNSLPFYRYHVKFKITLSCV